MSLNIATKENATEQDTAKVNLADEVCKTEDDVQDSSGHKVFHGGPRHELAAKGKRRQIR